MKKTDAMRAITKAFTTINEIESDADLKKQNLTLSDYNAARDLFPSLSTPGTTAHTIIKNVADLYSRAGFTVFESGNHYTITTAFFTE